MIKVKEEQELIRKYNFRVWTKNNIKYELSRLLNKEYKGYVGISINSGSSYNDGIGAIVNKLASEKKQKGLIVVSYNNIKEWYDREETIAHLAHNIKYGVNPDLIIKVHYLPAFIDTKKNIKLENFLETDDLVAA